MAVETIETERLIIRELDAVKDAAFILDLLNQPSFITNIGDRGVRTLEQSSDFIETRYRKAYIDHGYGLCAVELKSSGVQIGICGFVRRPNLDAPDIGFAFLPQFERQGYAFEAASATMNYGREKLGMTRVVAITTQTNDRSGSLLLKLGFKPDGTTISPDGEELKFYST